MSPVGSGCSTYEASSQIPPRELWRSWPGHISEVQIRDRIRVDGGYQFDETLPALHPHVHGEPLTLALTLALIPRIGSPHGEYSHCHARTSLFIAASTHLIGEMKPHLSYRGFCRTSIPNPDPNPNLEAFPNPNLNPDIFAGPL